MPKKILRVIKINFNLLVRRFPIWFYVLKWIILTGIIAVPIGSASAFFLFSLKWATDFRLANSWVMWFLPLGGLMIGAL